MFNKNLKKLRLKHGLSQKQVADHLQISPQSISKWEKGDALPSIEFLPMLSKCLSCEINDFFECDSEDVYDLELLKDFFAFTKACICDETKKVEEFLPFWQEHPDILNIIENLGDDLKQYQTVNIKTIQGILNCTESDSIVFLNYFINHELIEKIGADGSYFVIKSNIDGLRVVLVALIEMCELLSKQAN